MQYNENFWMMEVIWFPTFQQFQMNKSIFSINAFFTFISSKENKSTKASQ